MSERFFELAKSPET